MDRLPVVARASDSTRGGCVARANRRTCCSSAARPACLRKRRSEAALPLTLGALQARPAARAARARVAPCARRSRSRSTGVTARPSPAVAHSSSRTARSPPLFGFQQPGTKGAAWSSCRRRARAHLTDMLDVFERGDSVSRFGCKAISRWSATDRSTACTSAATLSGRLRAVVRAHLEQRDQASGRARLAGRARRSAAGDRRLCRTPRSLRRVAGVSDGEAHSSGFARTACSRRLSALRARHAHAAPRIASRRNCVRRGAGVACRGCGAGAGGCCGRGFGCFFGC